MDLDGEVVKLDLKKCNLSREAQDIPECKNKIHLDHPNIVEIRL